MLAMAALDNIHARKISLNQNPHDAKSILRPRQSNL
jgi:hypothetical protein